MGIFTENVRCPGCGGPLIPVGSEVCERCRIERAKFDPPPTQHAMPLPHPVAGEYGRAPIDRVVPAGVASFLDAHELLQYALMQVKVAETVGELARQEPRSVMLGFLRGSVSLIPRAEEVMYAQVGEGRVRLLPGHSGESQERSEQELHAALDEFAQAGIVQFILVDEMTSGSEIRRALNSVERWLSKKSVFRRYRAVDESRLREVAKADSHKSDTAAANAAASERD